MRRVECGIRVRERGLLLWVDDVRSGRTEGRIETGEGGGEGGFILDGWGDKLQLGVVGWGGTDGRGWVEGVVQGGY